MKPAPPPGFTTTQERHGPIQLRKEAWPARHPRTTTPTARPLTRARPIPNDWRQRTLHRAAAMLEAWLGTPKQGRVAISVNPREPSFVTTRQRTASVEGGTYLCNLRQQAPAHPPSPARSVVGRWPGRSGASRFGFPPGGAKHRAAGMGLAPIPWRQAKRAAPQARRREGLKPNGRDDQDGTGRSPKARRRIASTRPGRSIFSRNNPRQVHDHPAPTRNSG